MARRPRLLSQLLIFERVTRRLALGQAEKKHGQKNVRLCHFPPIAWPKNHFGRLPSFQKRPCFHFLREGNLWHCGTWFCEGVLGFPLPR